MWAKIVLSVFVSFLAGMVFADGGQFSWGVPIALFLFAVGIGIGYIIGFEEMDNNK